MNNKSFMLFAKCRTQDSENINFFSDDYSGSYSAVKFCQDCPVKKACLQYAIENEIYHGVWGGVSQNNRKKMIRQYLKTNHSSNRAKWQRIS
jgi:WhiB family redox-sensing transcriptional regulator